MECFYGIMTEYSDKCSDKYLSVNNFGYYKNIDTDMSTRRDKGRLDYQIIYIDKGYGSFRINNKAFEISNGNVVILHPGEKHNYTFKADSHADYYWIHFTGTGVEQLLKDLKLEGSIFKTGDFFGFKEIIEKMSENSVVNDLATEALLSANMLSLLSITARKIYTPDSTMHRVIESMQKDFTNKLTNKDYAKICGVSEYHFIRKFKNATGLTPHQYKTKLIVNRAMDLLTTTELNISEVSRIIGFDDSLYFSRVFKKETGMSPQKYLYSIQNEK